MSFFKRYVRLLWRILAVVVLLLACSTVALYIFVQKTDMRSYMSQLITPHVPQLKLEGEVRIGLWPSLHLDAHNVSHTGYTIKRVRLRLPLLPLIRFALWRTPQKDLQLDINELTGSGIDSVDAHVGCESDHDVFNCLVDATMNEWKTQLNVVYEPKETKVKGDVHYTNNTLHVVEGILNNQTYAFKGRVMLVGRSPIVVGTPQPIDVHYENNTLQLKAPILGLPYGDLKNINVKLKHHNKMVDITQLDLDAWKGHISLTGKVIWPQVTFKGTAEHVVLSDIKELQAYIEQGIGSADYHVTFNGDRIMESLNGQTHIKLTPVVVKGIDLVHLRSSVQNLNQLSLTDIPHLKEKLIKPGSMSVTCDLPITWTNGSGSMQKGRVEAKEAQANLSGQFDVKQVNGKAVVEGLPKWPPLTVLISGPWDKISYKPDFADLVQQLLHQGLKSAKENLKKTVQDGIKQVIQGGDNTASGDLGQKLQKEAGKLLGGLFGKRS